jgi:small GTP-binding protein
MAMAGPQRTPFRYDVFLSHSSADKPVVRELAQRLRTSGLLVWFDEWLIKPGDHIATAIDEGLEQSAMLLFCMSANAFGSDWVGLEGHTAIFRDPLNRERRFVPLRLDDAPIKAMLRGYAYIDWSSDSDRELEWMKLLAACRSPRERLGKSRPSLANSDRSVQPPPGSRILILEGHLGEVRSVAWSRDCRKVASGGEDGTVRVWDAGLCCQIAVFMEQEGPVRCIDWSPSGRWLVVGGYDGSVFKWSIEGEEQRVVLEGHIGPVSSVAWSRNGHQIVTGGFDGTVRLWDANSSENLTVLQGHKGSVTSVSWSSDCRYVFSAGLDGTLRQWDLKSQHEILALEGHMGSVTSISCAYDDHYLASGGGDGTVRLWSVAEKRELMVLQGHTGQVWSVGWSGVDQRLVSCGEDGMLRFWDALSGRSLSVLQGHRGQVWSVDWSRDGRRLVSGGNDGTVRMWEADSGKEVAVLEGHRGHVWSTGLSIDGSRLVSGGNDGKLRLWDVASGRQLTVLKGHTKPIRSVCWSRDGRQVVSAGNDGSVRIWDMNSLRLVKVLQGHNAEVTSVDFSSDGQRVVSGGSDASVRLWDVNNGEMKIALRGHKNSVKSVAWCSDGQRVVSGGSDMTLRVWDSESGRELAVLGIHRGVVNSVAWSCDGRRVVSGSDDGTVRVWDAESSREITVLEGHRGRVNSVAWSGEGQRVVSGGDDGTVRVWDAETGRELAILKGYTDSVKTLGWNVQDVGVWAAISSGLVILWNPEALERPQLSAGQESLTYTNAKVLVVGDSGSGKTGLTYRLATGAWQPSEASTVGAWSTQWALPQPVVFGAPQREVWLWDFGGQADQRLVHQLFLDQAALVLLLFDASREEVLDGLRDWQTALRRTLATPPPQILVAARIDAGFRVSRRRLELFAEEKAMSFVETSARDGVGCQDLQVLIQDTIHWDQLPLRTSPRLFLRIKTEILRLRDDGEVLLTYKDLRERLRQQLQRSNPDTVAGIDPSSLDDSTLQTVLGLLDGPGVLKQLDYGSYVLLKPEWLGVYGQAVLRSLRQAEPQLGALPVGAIAAGHLAFADGQRRLDATEEQVLLVELERQLQLRRICLREGGQLVFPSHCGRERPASPALPPKFVSYAVRGWLDDIHATLVVSLAETRIFELQELWRDAAAFRTGASEAPMAIQLRRNNATEGEITLHVGPGVADARRVEFAQFIHRHLENKAEQVTRLRYWFCPLCHCPKGNAIELMKKLQELGSDARVYCDRCEKPFHLLDDLERLFADPRILSKSESLIDQERPKIASRRKMKLLLLEVISRITSANQNWKEHAFTEVDGLDLQVEFTDDEGNGTDRHLFLQLRDYDRLQGEYMAYTQDNDDSISNLGGITSQQLQKIKRRISDSQSISGERLIYTLNPRWILSWIQKPFPVMLVVGWPVRGDTDGDLLNSLSYPFLHSPADGRAYPEVRWMEISSKLKRELANGCTPSEIRHIEFDGEPLDLASVLRWRRRMLDG